jgi:ribosome maturation factor RimP
VKALGSILFAAVVFLSVELRAAIDEMVTVKGTVKSFDKKEVTLELDGYTFSVPREAISKEIKLEYNKPIQFQMKFDLVVLLAIRLQV